MGILEDITAMRGQGMDDRAIIQNLNENGYPPRSIESAFNQLKIKDAVSAEYSGGENMEPSIMKNEHMFPIAPPPQKTSPVYTPKTQEINHNPEEEFYSPQQMPQPNELNPNPGYAIEYGQEQYYEPAQYPPQYSGQEQYLSQETYSEQQMQGEYADNVIEVAEQVFIEKIKKPQKQIDILNEFATLAEAKISDDHERIKRIESMIDKLQIAILEKIGSYGRDVSSIKNEMGMMRESFEKIVPKLHEDFGEKKPLKGKK